MALAGDKQLGASRCAASRLCSVQGWVGTRISLRPQAAPAPLQPSRMGPSVSPARCRGAGGCWWVLPGAVLGLLGTQAGQGEKGRARA